MSSGIAIRGQGTTASENEMKRPRCEHVYTFILNNCQAVKTLCRRKMRMSGLCKVEMSAFMDVRGPHGDGANHFEPTRTGPIESAARGTAEASFAGSGSGAAESNRPPGAADAAADSRARGWCPGSRITRPAIESQAGGPLGAEGFGSRGSALCRLRAHAGRRTLSQGWFRVEPGDSADVDDQSGLLASALPAGEKDPRVAGAKS